MTTIDNYTEYAQAALANYAKKDAASRYLLFDAVKDRKIECVLDIGCGPGQELLPFLERSDAFCVGVDVAEGLGNVTKEVFGDEPRAAIVRTAGELLPFPDESFDVILCRVALPYMNNRKAIAEAARVLLPNGVYLLKTHARPFYFGMVRERLLSLDPKMLAYPLICLAGSVWHSLTGRQLETGFWIGKEIYQTRAFLDKEFEKNGMRIEELLPDDNPQTPSYLVVKR
ncbi:hypothetical protein BH10ACI3_BH10ACI3_18630 [soil metagenome]